MNKGPTPRAKSHLQASPSDLADELAFVVELWDMPRSRCERLLGRAETFEVACAIYEAVVQEHPFRLIVVRQGDKVVKTSA